MKYVKREDGEGWVVKNRIPFRLGCCDCGLVHDVVVSVPDKRKGSIVGIAAGRNERATAQKRRKRECENCGGDIAKGMHHVKDVMGLHGFFACGKRD